MRPKTTPHIVSNENNYHHWSILS